jgi:glutamine amidotransferase
MPDAGRPVAIVDYGVGNLFSVRQACAAAGLQAVVTSDVNDLRRSSCIVLPGIGAFGDAMAALSGLNLIECLRRAPSEGIPLVGICLGMQLLMERSTEFGSFEGLALVPGGVERLTPARREMKVPQVGWNGIYRAGDGARCVDPWAASALRGTADGEPMYFVHSYVVKPASPDVVLARSTYAGEEFCSALTAGNVTGFQFHPERSGPAGLRVYQNLATMLTESR